MNFNLSALAVRERALTLFFILAIMVSGTFAFLHLGRAEDPKFVVKVMTVGAVWPGATAKEMVDQVGDKFEKRLQELEYYDRVETQATPGKLVMKVFFQEYTGPHLAEQFYQARKKLGDEAVNLPNGVVGPIINDEYSDVYFSLYALKAKGMPERKLVLEAESIRQRLLRVDGIEKVNILGEQEQRIYVDISYQRLATLGVKAADILQALRLQNDVTQSGFVDTKGPRVYIRLDGAFDDVEVVKNIPINANGKILRIGEIADVKRGYVDPAVFTIHHDGEPSLMLGIVMSKNFNGLTLGETLGKEMDAVQANLPLGIELSKVAYQSTVIEEAVDEFMIKFVAALAVVMIVSLITLGFRVGIVVALAVPLTLAAVLVVMLLTDREFDRITLGALILSLGLLVDDAIISIEMMVVKMEEGWDRVKAATYSWTSTAAPMLFGTLITIAGFLPVGFAKSGAGEYAGNIFWVVAFSLITSWVVAVTLTPYIGVKLLPEIKKVKGGHDAIYKTPTYERFRNVVRGVIRHKWAVGITVLFLFFLSVFGMGFVQQQFFPDSDRPEMLLDVNLPPGSAFSTTEAAVQRIEQKVMAQSEAKIVTSYIGQGMPRFVLTSDPMLPNPAYAQIIVMTDGPKERNALKEKMHKLIEDGAFPEARVRVRQFVFGPPTNYPVLFRVIGPDENVLRDIADQVKEVMDKSPTVKDTFLDWTEKTPIQFLVFDQDRLRLIGLTPNDVGVQLGAMLNGIPATQVRDGIRTVGVMLRNPQAERLNIDDLANLTLTTIDGKSVPLSQIAHFETRMENAMIKRYDHEQYISVQADVAEGLQPPVASMAVMEQLKPIIAKLPEGYRIDMGGSIEDSIKANDALAVLFPVMILLQLAFIMFQVRSFSTMFMVFLTAPLGLVGAVPTMLIFNSPFGFNAILGLIALSGILMRNTLILVDQIRIDRASGLSDYDAIVESTVRRSRPVILTAATAMLAFIPLTYSSFWGSLAFVLIGGVGVGTLLTLLFLPALYALWFRIKPVNHTDTSLNNGHHESLQEQTNA
ncbi:multidrug transporter [Methylovorus sp. MM2]|uniref:efflux RND transporter permease subunit n=1 Tax=Methylovorus sp. MM2 TaxID=1848038 RepID=UPI0007DEFA02|nr:efflux RND transporter permease subunit [Methylovorus sp. MM2]OAM52547.1 multidrug transporter [Methylovorus sp. MM2]